MDTQQKLAGISLPIWLTEAGISTIGQQNYATALKRRMLVFAGLGSQCFVGYASDYDVGPLGSPELSAAWNQMAQIIPGSTISNMVKNPDGSITAIVNGSPITV